MLKTFQKSMSGETNRLTETFTDLTTQEKLVLYPIALLVLLIGVYPAPLLEISEAAVTQLVNTYSNYSASIK
jgi:NADH-quinone oxidoreductase subunit M